MTGIPRSPLWTEELYDSICQRIESGDLSDNFGLRERCLFNKLESFHAVDQFPFDCMHDFYEKIGQFDGQAIVLAFVKARVFTVKAYNASLAALHFDLVESGDKPMPVNPKIDKLGGKALAVALHLRLMPLIISRITNVHNYDNCSHLVSLLTLLHQLNEFMLLDAAAPADAATLQELIVKYFRTREKCVNKYGAKIFLKLTPKYHFLEHYPEQLLLFGPFNCVWTARCESKHRDFVNFLESSKNYINILKTMAWKTQKRLAARSYTGFFTERIYNFPAKLFTVQEGAGHYPQDIFHASDLLTEKVCVRNTNYKVGHLVITSATSNDLIEVAQILKVVVRADKLFILGEMFKCKRNKMQIFKARPLNEIQLFPYSAIVDYKPLVKRSTGNFFEFILHHRLPGHHVAMSE